MRKWLYVCFSFFLMFSNSIFCNTNSLLMAPQELKCDYLNNPVGIDNLNPFLSWKNISTERAQKQKAYRIVASSTKKKLLLGTYNIWDSGKIISEDQLHIPYDGLKLKSEQRIFWKVMVWDKNDKASLWSEVSYWEMALVNPSDWSGKWVSDGRTNDPTSFKTYPAPYFRKEFNADSKIVSARAYISGLGYYELSLNGKKVGDLQLSPNQTNYDKRELKKLLYDYDDQSTTRVLYNTFDITEDVKAGTNTIGVVLGNGWYNQRDRRAEGWMWYDTPRMIVQLKIKYEDGSSQLIVSDDTWKYSTGAILYNGIFRGEHVDARLEKTGWNKPKYDDSEWKKAVLTRAPTGIMRAQVSPADKIINSFNPITLEKKEPGVYLADMGQMISGWINLKIKGKSGDKIKIRHIEEKGGDYSQIDYFTLSGNGVEVFEPKFTWHAFRTVEISGVTSELKREDITARVVNSAVDTVGKFNCSNELFNNIYKNYVWTQLGNFHSSFSSDCPHRERLGYTGDGQILVESSIYSFDMAQFYNKWLTDMDDARNKISGFVPHTAPFGGGGGGPAWGSSFVVVPWFYYLHYGDKNILKKHYDGMKHWVTYLGTRTDSTGLVVREEPNGWCLGDWASPKPMKLPEPLVNTSYYYYVSHIFSKIANVLGNETDRKYYSELAEKIKVDLNKYYLNETQYWNSSQGADVFPLAFDMVPKEKREKVINSMIENLEKNDVHFDTGILATPLILDLLTQEKREDLSFMLMNQRDFPSFGDYIVNEEATTLWEYFDGSNSHSHPMYGSVCKWFYKSLAGINIDEQSPGMKNILLKPIPCGDINFVNAEYESLYGKIKSNWKLNNGNMKLSVEIPTNTTSTIYIPTTKRELVTESGKIPEKQFGIKFLKMEDQYAVYSIGSGSYEFEIKNVVPLIKKVALPAPVLKPGKQLYCKPEKAVISLEGSLDNTDIYYTIDGSLPTESSLKYVNPIELTNSVELNAISISSGFNPSHICNKLIRFIDKDKNGFKYTVFEGKWSERPDMKKIVAVDSGRVFNYDVNKIKRRGDFVAILYEGFLKIVDEGNYTFYAEANNGCLIKINDKTVVDNAGYSGPLEKKGNCNLKPGLHPISIFYFENEGSERMDLEIEGPGIRKQTLPEQLIYFSN